jgi:modification methylase
MCGIGTTLVEGAALGRRCVGVELEARWAGIAEANLDHVLTGDQRGLAEVRVGDARLLPEVLGSLAGTVDLIATSPPYACEAARIDRPAWLAGGTMRDADSRNYSTDRANLGHARGDAYATAMAAVYAACFTVLRPGGLLVTVTKNMRRGGQLIDLAATTHQLVTAAGFAYLQHLVALLAGIRDGGLIGRPSFWQLTQTRKARQKGDPLHVVVHEDVLVFTKPQEAARG